MGSICYTWSNSPFSWANARLAWSDGYMSKYTEGWGGIAKESVENFLSKSYSERDKEMIHI